VSKNEHIRTRGVLEMKEKIRKILDYVIPIYVMETFDENEETFKSMAEAFIRVNRYGVRIGVLLRN
jgi:hypothetical protein